MKRLASWILCLCVCLGLGLTLTDAWAKGPKKLQAVAVLAHSGYITGRVVACDPDEAVPGALVHIPGLSIMAKTGPEGRFLLLYVPQGLYTLAVEVPGRPPLVIEGVRVRKKEFTELGDLDVCPECLDNRDCPEDAFCAKEMGDCEGRGTCEPRPEVCIEIWDPVCGCDGVTYSNGCAAARAGVSPAYPGECEEPR